MAILAVLCRYVLIPSFKCNFKADPVCSLGNDMECQKYFGVQANEAIIQSDQVSCITEFSQVLPLENGEIYVSLTDGRELIGEDFKNWTLATNIRLRLIQTKTMLSHLTSIAVGDLNVLRRVKKFFLHFIH